MTWGPAGETGGVIVLSKYLLQLLVADSLSCLTATVFIHAEHYTPFDADKDILIIAGFGLYHHLWQGSKQVSQEWE